MIFLLVFIIDVCSGMVMARFISITPLTHLKKTQQHTGRPSYKIVQYSIVRAIVGVIAPHRECCHRTKGVSVTGKMY